MKKIICHILTAVCILTLLTAAGCGKDKELPVISACIAGEPETMDPTLCSDAGSYSYLAHVYEGLTTWNNNLEITPGAAQSWTVSPDGAVYTFSIHPDAAWSDGRPVTASDFVFAWKRLIDPQTNADNAYLAFCIKNAQRVHFGELPPGELGLAAPDARTLQVTLEAPSPYFLSLVASPAFFPVRSDMVQSGADWSLTPSGAIGNGPFLIKEWTRKDSMLLGKNPHYWNQAETISNDLQFFFITDPDAIYSAFQKKDLLFASNFSPDIISGAKKDGDLTMQNMQSTYAFAFNTLKKPYDNPLVRRALSLAVDRDYLIKSIWMDERIPAAALVPPGVPGPGATDFRTASGDYFAYDTQNLSSNIQEARALLTEAGYEGGAGFPRINLLIDASQSSSYIAQSIQQQWRDNLGIDVYINQKSSAALRSARSGSDWDMSAVFIQGAYSHPLAFLNMWNSDSAQNIAKYMNPEYDRLVNDALRSTDEAARMRLLQSAEAILIGRDMALIPLSYGMDPYLSSPRLSGVVSHPLGTKYFMWAQVKTK